jgi:ComF family protein
MIHRILNVLFPPKCILCGRILKKNETDLCRVCRVEAPEYSKGNLNVQFLDSFAAVWYYEENVRRSILRYKFYGARNYAPAYGRLLAMKVLTEYPEGFDLITWVPVSTLRKLRRGYDQVELLARAVSLELGIPCGRVLKKIRHNRPQSGINGFAQRRANVLGAYRVTDPETIKGKRILLLDDVITTGATVGECARVLLTGGGAEVHCAVLAAARKHNSR